jgi:hypothetical protein
MSDPKRWLDSVDELGDAERRALVAGRDLAPPADFRSEAWAALALKLPPPGSPPAGGAPAAGTSATGGATGVASGTGLVAVVKAATVGALFGAAVLTGRSMMKPADTPRREVATAAPVPVVAPDHERPVDPMPAATQPDLETTAAAPAPRAKVLEPTPAAASEPRERTPTVEPASPPAPEPAIDVPPRAPLEVAPDPRQESRAIAAARDALRSGQFASALATLEETRLRYPNGILGQEREALTIEALVAADRRAEAEKRAAAFLRDHPESPHAARVRAVLR